MDAGIFLVCSGDPLWLAGVAGQPEEHWNDGGAAPKVVAWRGL